MLFDLRGKRRRAVQATYLMLAVLMGGGLVLFGIGGDVSGGLFDAFSDAAAAAATPATTRSRSASSATRRAARRRTRTTRPPCAELVRDHYQLATARPTTGAVGFPEEARDELRKAAAHWQRYLEARAEKPDPSLAARYALQVYDAGRAEQAEARRRRRPRSWRERDNDAQSYLQLVAVRHAGRRQAHGRPGRRTKAVDLAPQGREAQGASRQLEAGRSSQAEPRQRRAAAARRPASRISAPIDRGDE